MTGLPEAAAGCPPMRHPATPRLPMPYMACDMRQMRALRCRKGPHIYAVILPLTASVPPCRGAAGLNAGHERSLVVHAPPTAIRASGRWWRGVDDTAVGQFPVVAGWLMPVWLLAPLPR